MHNPDKVSAALSLSHMLAVTYLPYVVSAYRETKTMNPARHMHSSNVSYRRRNGVTMERHNHSHKQGETMKEITPINQMRLEIKRLVGNDNAAAQAAIEFIQDDQLKWELFQDAYNNCQTETQFVARAQKAAREAQEALDLFIL